MKLVAITYIVFLEPSNIILYPPMNSVIPQGSTIEIVCVASGYPLPSIVWSNANIANLSAQTSTNTYVYNEVVDNNGVWYVKSVLQICDFAANDQNTYRCEANNYIQPSSRIFSLQFESKPLALYNLLHKTVLYHCRNTCQ